jgi:hypothetical protein
MSAAVPSAPRIPAEGDAQQLLLGTFDLADAIPLTVQDALGADVGYDEVYAAILAMKDGKAAEKGGGL